MNSEVISEFQINPRPNQDMVGSKKSSLQNTSMFRILFLNQCHLMENEALKLAIVSKVLGQLPPGQLPPGQLPPDNYPRTITPLGQIPPGQLPPQITEFPKHKSTKFTSHKVYKSQKVHKLRGQSHNIYEYKFYKIQVSTKVWLCMVMANFGHLVAFKKAVLGWHKAENMRRSVLHMLMLWASPRRYCIMLRLG